MIQRIVTLSAPTLLLIALFVTSLGAGHAYAQKESTVAMAQPTKDSKVGKEVLVRGTASMPNGHYLWVVARRIDFAPLWWPQRPVPLDSTPQTWQATAVFGGPQDVGWEFDVGVVTVDEEGHRKLMDYWKKAMSTGDWRPIDIPPVTSPPRIVKVKKVSH